MEKQILLRPAPHSLRVATRMAGLLCILLVAAAYQPQRRSAADQVSPSELAAAKGTGPQVPRYLRMGRWQGDARTMAAAIRYLLEPEPLDQPAGQLAATPLAMLTNSILPMAELGNRITMAHQGGEHPSNGPT